MANYAKRNAKSIALVLKMLNVEGVNSTPQLCKYLRKHFRICNAQQKKIVSFKKRIFCNRNVSPEYYLHGNVQKKLNPNWRQTSFDGPVEKCSRIQQANPNDFIKNAVN